MLRSPLIVLGTLIAGISGFFHFTLFLLHSAGGSDNPYLDILFYVLLPGVFLSGVAMAGWGRHRFRKKEEAAREAEGAEAEPAVPLSLAAIVGSAVIGLGVLAFTGYSSYAVFHYSESVGFCGATCHVPMGPTHAAYLNSPHQKIDCVACHVGDGPRGFVEAKLAGSVQLWETIWDSFSRPIVAPRSKSNVAADACHKCHTPENSSHFRLEFRTAIAANEKNTFRPLFMTLRTSASPKIIQPESYHWHRSKVEYSSTDEKGMEINWIRSTRPDGTVKVFRADGVEGTEPPGTVYEMQCIDCHNRVGHDYASPDELVNGLFSRGELDYTLPFLKREAAGALAAAYDNVDGARQGIGTRIREYYQSAHPELASARQKDIDAQIETLVAGYEKNLFPEMRADWRSYPDHSGHWYSEGCFRCHDGRHTAEDGSRISNDCTLCHSFYQEEEKDGVRTYVEGQYKHPWDLNKVDHARYPCSSCHRGGATPPADCVGCHDALALERPPEEKK